VNGEILVPANPCPPGKMAVKMERQREIIKQQYMQLIHPTVNSNVRAHSETLSSVFIYAPCQYSAS